MRRWYLVPLGLAGTAALCLLVTMAVPLRYSAEAEILLLPPATSVGEGGNPYAVLGDLGPAVDVLSRTMTDPRAGQELKSAGASGTYDVVPDGASPAPLVLITVESESPKSALSSLNLLVARVPATLRKLQRELSVTGDALITSTVVTRSASAVLVRKPQIRALLVAGVAGAGATILGIAAVDALLFRRHRRKRTKPLDAFSGNPADAAAALTTAAEWSSASAPASSRPAGSSARKQSMSLAGRKAERDQPVAESSAL